MSVTSVNPTNESNARSLSLVTNLKQSSNPIRTPMNSLSAPAYTQHTPLLTPQSLFAFHPERHYLLLALQRENLKSANLSHKIPPIEATLATSTVPKVRRKAKKQLSWLRCRIKECSHQEQVILDRLGQLSFQEQEQTRQRINRMEHERRLGEHWQMVNRQMAVCQEYMRLTQGMQNMNLNLNLGSDRALDPSTPAFEPSGFSYFPEFPASAASTSSPTDIETPLSGEAPAWLPMNYSPTSRKTDKQWDEELSPLAEEDSEESGFESEGETAITTPTPAGTPKYGSAVSENEVRLDLFKTSCAGILKSAPENVKRKRRGSMPVVGNPKWIDSARVKRVKVVVVANDRDKDRSYDRYLGYYFGKNHED